MKRRQVIASLAALSGVQIFPARAQTLRKVHAVAAALDQSGALYYARDLGLFEKHGLDVSIDSPSNNALAVPSVVSNSVDIAYTAIIAIEQAFKKGIPIVAIAPAAVNDSRRPNNYLLVLKNSPIKTAIDLEGKTLGTAPLRGQGDFATDAWVAMHHGDPTKLKWIEIPYIACMEAMENGRIDAAFMVEPYATQVRAKTRLLGRPYEAIANRFLGAAYFTSTQWATANPDLVARFATAIREASVWANKNQDKSAVFLEKYAHVDPATIAAMTRAVYGETLRREEIQPTIDFAARYKIIDGTFPADEIIYRA